MQLESGVNGCMGVRTTPGSENTDKVLVGGNLDPGSTVTFEISYPVDPADVAGRTTFVITDCVFINDVPVQKYSVSFVPNTTNFVLSFDLTIPADAPIGAEYCNYAKTTAAPSTSQASNRKAGPACFRIGGDLRVLKVDTAGNPLTGALFDVVCTPSGPVPPVLIEGVDRDSADNIGTGGDNAISITGPEGTSCVITEVQAPPGYEIAGNPSVTAVIGVDGPNIVFVNDVARGNLTVTKTVSGGSGTFNFTVNCTGTAFDQNFSLSGGQTKTITGIPVGTVCTVTEAAATGFTTVVVPSNGTVTIDANGETVAFTNTRDTGGLTVTKTVVGGSGTFTFRVDCDGAAFDTTFQLSGGQSNTITGIPTGTTCTVTEDSNVDFTTEVTPTGGVVVIDTNGETVAFTNTFIPREPPPGGEGCTPGFWKNHQLDWTGYSPGQTLGSVFTGLPNSLANATLLEALDFEGGNNLNGAKRILLRAAVAALLNASSADVDYPRTTGEILADVNAALASGNRSTILDLALDLDTDNNLGCPL